MPACASSACRWPSDFTLDRDAILAAVERERPALIFLAYPNNPTGNLFAATDVEAIIRAAPGLVVVDEAYHAFADASFLPRLAEFPNLLVLRTRVQGRHGRHAPGLRGRGARVDRAS